MFVTIRFLAEPVLLPVQDPGPKAVNEVRDVMQGCDLIVCTIIINRPRRNVDPDLKQKKKTHFSHILCIGKA